MSNFDLVLEVDDEQVLGKSCNFVFLVGKDCIFISIKHKYMKILGIGKNYVNDKTEISTYKNGKQIIFSKPTTSLVVANEDVPYPSITKQLVYEVELVAKIGKQGKDIDEATAASYISELALGIDFTAKDVLNVYRETKHPWDLAKGFDGAAPISSFNSFA